MSEPPTTLGVSDPARRRVRIYGPRVGSVRVLLRIGDGRRRAALRRRPAPDHDWRVAGTGGSGDLRAGEAGARRSARLALRPGRRRAARRTRRLRGGVARRLRRHPPRPTSTTRLAPALYPGGVSYSGCHGWAIPTTCGDVGARRGVRERVVLVRDPCARKRHPGARRCARGASRPSTTSTPRRLAVTQDTIANAMITYPHIAGFDAIEDAGWQAINAATPRRARPRSRVPSACRRAAVAVARMINGLEVSRLSLGCAPLANLYADVDPETADATIHAALDRGITYFDTAPHYGAGCPEQRTGAALPWRAAASHSASRPRSAACSNPGAERPDLRGRAGDCTRVRLLRRRRAPLARRVTRSARPRPRRHRARARSRRPHGPGDRRGVPGAAAAGATKASSAPSAPA